MTAYGDIVRAMRTAVQTVDAVKVVLLYEPAQVQDWPLVYITLASWGRGQASQVTSNKPRIRARLLVPVPTSEDLEIQAVETSFAIADAVDANPQFSGVIVEGMAQTPDANAGYIPIGGTLYRAIDIFCVALFKQPYAWTP